MVKQINSMLYNHKESSTFHITDNKKSVYIHKQILSNYSSYYKNKFMNGWKDVDKLVVTLIKPYEFVMEFIYKRNMSGIDLVIEYVRKRNESVVEFNSTELYELLDYTNQTLMLQDDMKLARVVFEFIIKHFEVCKDYTPGLLKMVLVCLQIKFKVPNQKLEEIIVKLKNHLCEYINKMDMTCIDLDENDFEYLQDKLTFEMNLYQSLVLANTKQKYTYLNKIDPYKIKDYLITKPNENVMEQYYQLYDEKYIELLLNLNIKDNEIIVFKNGGLWHNYPPNIGIKIGTVAEKIDNTGKILRIENIQYYANKGDTLILCKTDNKSWSRMKIVNVSPAFWSEKDKEYTFSTNAFKIQRNMHILIEAEDKLTDIVAESTVWIDLKYEKKN